MKVAVIGLGKVGLPMATYFYSVGHDVVGVETDQARVDRFLNGDNVLPWEPDTFPIQFEVTSKFDTNIDVAYVIVPTPMIGDKLSADLVVAACTEIRQSGFTGLIVVGSTLDPRDIVRVEQCGRPIAYSPPLIRLGRVVADLTSAPLLLIGGDSPVTVASMWGNRATRIVGDMVSIATAKLAINTTLSTRIAWANEVASVCDSLGANADVVLAALRADPRIGPAYLAAGWPPGGPCLPRDLKAWVTMAKTPMAEAVQQGHTKKSAAMIKGLLMTISSVIDPNVAVLGLMYNPGGFDLTLSLGEAISNALMEGEIPVLAYDPAAQYFPYAFNFPLGDSAQETIEHSNVVVVATLWDEFRGLDFGDRLVLDMTRPIR